MGKTSADTSSAVRGKFSKGPALGKVLVMDDDEAVRFIAGRSLSRLGFQAEFAEDGDQALELYRQAMESGEPFSAVIMDLTIPGGMGGKDAVRRLLEMDPDAIAFVASGYFNDPVMIDYQDYGFKGAIAKPFHQDDLAAALKELFPSLDSKSV